MPQILYFMAGLRAEVDVYFFFLLVVWVGKPTSQACTSPFCTYRLLVQIACLAFLSFGMLLSTILGKMNAAQGGMYELV